MKKEKDKKEQEEKENNEVTKKLDVKVPKNIEDVEGLEYIEE